ncbi:MAG: MASE1 domain-containing protein [Heteroscytonema crispum UTEX LB 1556]
MKRWQLNLFRLKQPGSWYDFLKWLALVIVLAALYYGAAQLGISLAFSIGPSNITPVWPPAAIALAAVLSLGYKVAPGIWLGDIFVNLPSYIQITHNTAASILAAIIKASASTSTAVLAAFLIQRFTENRFGFHRAQDVFKYALIVMLCPMITATVGLSSMCMAGICLWTNYQTLWLTFWLGDGMSFLVLTPILLVWQYLPRFSFKPRKFIEALLLLLVILGVGKIAFRLGYPVEYLLIPCLEWAAFRFGQVGAIASVFIVSSMALWATAQGLGPFVRGSLNESLLLLQTFMGVIAVTTFVLSAVLAEYKRSQTALFNAKDELETRVEERTAALQHANDQLIVEIGERKHIEAALRQSETEKIQLIASLQEKATTLAQTLQDLQTTEAQLLQTEKMSSLGQLIVGVAHEINNPVNFIYANLTYVNDYTQQLLNIIKLYQQVYPDPKAQIKAQLIESDLDFIIEDLPQILSSMEIGTDRIREIVLTLRNFSRVDEAAMKAVNIHKGIDSTLLILRYRLKATSQQSAIEIIKEYGDLPQVECYAGQLNQVFMNILANAIDALNEYDRQRTREEIQAKPSIIRIRTAVIDNNWVAIYIADNGSGMNEEVRSKLFDTFFTTKPAGKGTGLGLSISYEIVVKNHRGKMWCNSVPGQGAEFAIEIPIRQLNQV